MRRAALAVLLLLAGARPAAARGPRAHMAVVGGGRSNTGALGDSYRLGYVYGAEAGYQPGVLGVAWSLLFGAFDSTSTSNPDSRIDLVEMELALRARVGLGAGEINSYTLVWAGLEIVRASTPIPPDADRQYLGPSVGTGLQFVIADEFLITLGARYSLIFGGPTGVTVMMSLGVGGY